MNAQKKQITEIEPIPTIPPYIPKKIPEITPKPDKNIPYHPMPEIKPNHNPEIIPIPQKEK